MNGYEPTILEAGDLALVPRGAAHRLASGHDETHSRDEGQLPTRPVGDGYAVRVGGRGGAPTTLACGAVTFDHPLGRQLVDALPRVVHVRAPPDPEARWLEAAALQMAMEVRHPRPGGAFVFTRLADVMVIQAIRAWLEQVPRAGHGWLGALRDPHVGHVLAMIHRDPAREWTVAGLAAEASLSRSAFAERFARLVGESPMLYLARRRMELATTSLRDGNAVPGEVARRVGYRSESAFSRVHKRIVGRSPRAVRRPIPEAPEAAVMAAMRPVV